MAEPTTTDRTDMATTALRDPADLEAEVAALRGQATKLHSEAAQRFEKSLGEAGGARDEAAAEAWALREKAKAADIQAKREHREATEIETQAAEYEAEAAKLQQAGHELEAEELREDADALRAMARSHTQRAAAAEQRVQDAINEAEPLEQRVRDHEADKTFDRRPSQINQVADQVDDKVRLLEEAIAARAEALRLRDAGDTEKAVEAAQRAVDAQAAADALQPDYGRLEADVRALTGIEDPAVEMDPAPADPSHIEMEPEAARVVDPTLMASPDQAPPDAPARDAGSGQVADPITPAAATNMQPATRIVGTGPDSDRDGLSDDFETNVFSSDPTEKDADGDGLNDWAEYWLDTKPKEKDSDGDGWEDGEDLAFGDPLRQNAGGPARADLLRRAREQFEQEGSDRDHDLVRDHLEKQFGTNADDADSDGDGLGDMVEIQLRTDPLSSAGSTADLDTARARLDPRRAISDAPPAPAEGSSSLIPDADGQDDFAVPEAPAVDAPAFDTPTFEEPAPDDTTFAEPVAVDPVPGAADGEMFDA